VPKLYKFVCDNCGKTEDSIYTYGSFYRVNVGISGKNYNSYNDPKEFYICPECAKKLGIMDETEQKQLINNYTPTEQLYDLIAEIARNSVNE
jgi:uncharacterized protein YlaI